MPARLPPRWTPPSPEPDLEDGDTLAVPLTSADTLPCPRLDFADPPTLRTTPQELAALIRLMQPSQPPPAVPAALPHPADRRPAVCLPDPGQTLPLPRVELLAATRPPQPWLGPSPAHLQARPALAGTRPPLPGPSLTRPQPAPALAVTRPPPPPGPRITRSPVLSRRSAGRPVGPADLASPPTELWFSPGVTLALATPARPPPRSLWDRLGTWLGLAGLGKAGNPAHHPGYHRHRFTRR